MANEQENWSLQLTLHADVRPMGVFREEPPAGAYEVTCTKSELGHAKDDPSKPYIRLTLKVTGPAGNPAMGMEFTDIVNLPNGKDAAKDKTMEGFLKTTLVSFGQDKARLGAVNATIPFGPAAFNTKVATIHFEPSAGQGTYSNVTFLERTDYAKVLAGELRIQTQRKPAAGNAGQSGGSFQGAGGAGFDPLGTGAGGGGATVNGAATQQPPGGASAVDAFLS